MMQATILIAEDDNINQQILMRHLDALDYTCEFVENGAMVINKLKQNDYYLIIMDLDMPLMDGFETLKQIQGQNISPNVPIIAITAFPEENSHELCKKKGFHGFLAKPIKKDLLNRMILKLINQDNVNFSPEEEENILEYFDHDPIFLDKAFQLFLKTYHEKLIKIKQAIEKKDFTELRQYSHALKSSMCYFGDSPGLSILQSIEKSARDNEDKDYNSLIADFDNHIAFLKEKVTHILIKNKAS